jgi:hypothetical protein
LVYWTGFTIAQGEKLARRSCCADWFSCDWTVTRWLTNNFGTLAIVLVSKINNNEKTLNHAMAPSSPKKKLGRGGRDHPPGIKLRRDRNMALADNTGEP